MCGWIKGEYALTPHVGNAMRFTSPTAAREWQRERKRVAHEFYLTPEFVLAEYNARVEGWPRYVEPYESDPAYPPLTAKERASQEAWMRGKMALAATRNSSRRRTEQ